MYNNYYHSDELKQTAILKVCTDWGGMFDIHGIIYRMPYDNFRKATYKEILEYLKVEWDRQFDMLSNDQYKDIDSSLKINYIEDAFFIYHLEHDIEIMKECRD